ncbi:MAG: Ig-like domain-containing protein [Bacteroidetes bacterium]|nr:Ig-like domain-containing protein [Bacteroidota bacterium]
MKVTFRSFLPLLFGLSSLAGLASCANQQYPGGGPVDTEAPTIEATTILSGTTRFTSDRIGFRFSEYMDKNSVRNALFISPSVGQDFELTWSGRDMDLRFKKPLRDGVTYVVTLGTGAKDYRAGNPMAQSVQLAFSTGETIDSSRIRGQAWSAANEKPVSGALVLAYNRLIKPEPDPSADTADYVTQTGADGRFELTYLKEGEYRLFVITDQFRNDRWDAKTEGIGVGRSPVIRAVPSPDTTYSFYVQVVDQFSPVMQGVVPESPVMLKVTMNESADSDPDSIRFSLMDEEKRSFRVHSWLIMPGRQDQFLLITDSLRETSYTLVQRGMSDERLNRSAGDTFQFSIASVPAPPKSLFSVFPADTLAWVGSQEPVILTFRRPVANVDSLRVTGYPSKSQRPSPRLLKSSIRQIHPHQLMIHPSPVWPQGFQITGWLKTAADTVEFGFRTVDPEETGGLKGVVPGEGKGMLVVIDAQTGKPVRKIALTTGSFQVNGLPGGRYVLSGFDDQNQNRLWDSGEPLPWKPAEFRYFYSDTVRVRARWMVEDIRLDRR